MDEFHTCTHLHKHTYLDKSVTNKINKNDIKINKIIGEYNKNIK